MGCLNNWNIFMILAELRWNMVTDRAVLTTRRSASGSCFEEKPNEFPIPIPSEFCAHSVAFLGMSLAARKAFTVISPSLLRLPRNVSVVGVSIRQASIFPRFNSRPTQIPPAWLHRQCDGSLVTFSSGSYLKTYIGLNYSCNNKDDDDDDELGPEMEANRSFVDSSDIIIF